MKKQAFNPYLPSWEYVPDGEPYVFDGRVYVYGSHDIFNSHVFCLGDYVCYSAPVDDLGNWRYEGVIYKKTDDPLNQDGKAVLYAPDVTVGPDGRYYLFYVLDHYSVVSVAVCDTPAGKYEFYGYVHYQDGTRLGEKETDEPQFDPGVLTEGDITYLYTGFCGPGDKSRTGSYCCVLDKDMLTIIEEPVKVAPGCEYAKGTDFEEHPFFEASSIRKINDTYYFIYSSTVMHELCYATSKSATKDFKFGGVIVSNTDLGIDSYKAADRPVALGGNNHGSIVEIEGEWYIFYHRQTNACMFSRQGCAEKITVLEDGSIPQVRITSYGLNGKPLEAKGEYYGYIACHLMPKEEKIYASDEKEFRIMQDGRDGDEEPGYVGFMSDGCTAGFVSFDCRDVSKIAINVRGYMYGAFEFRNKLDGPVIGRIDNLHNCNVWERYETDIDMPDGENDLYITYVGGGTIDLLSFEMM